MTLKTAQFFGAKIYFSFVVLNKKFSKNYIHSSKLVFIHNINNFVFTSILPWPKLGDYFFDPAPNKVFSIKSFLHLLRLQPIHLKCSPLSYDLTFSILIDTEQNWSAIAQLAERGDKMQTNWFEPRLDQIWIRLQNKCDFIALFRDY